MQGIRGCASIGLVEGWSTCASRSSAGFYVAGSGDLTSAWWSGGQIGPCAVSS